MNDTLFYRFCRYYRYSHAYHVCFVILSTKSVQRAMPQYDNDKQFFRDMMRDVKPLRPTPPRAPLPRQPTPPIKRNHQSVAIHIPSIQSPLSNPYDLNITAEMTLSYGQNNIPRKRFSELKHGKIPKQARLDLHGLQVDKARETLWRFITDNHAEGTRCVLVIHGKGGADFKHSVLKSHVNHWLQQLPNVMAFHSARPCDGGTGALYVLLKKNTN